MSTINIKNQELVRKIKEAADRRHVGVTAALNEILDKELDRPRLFEPDDPAIQHWLEIGRRNRELHPDAIGSQDIDEYLYDEHGLPK